MAVEIREIWVNGVSYTIEDAQKLLEELQEVLMNIEVDAPEIPILKKVREMATEEIPGLDDDPRSPERRRQDEIYEQNLFEAGLDRDDNPVRTHHCSTCGEEGHNKQTCTAVDNSKRYRCTTCGEIGHNRRTCPNPIRDEETPKDNRRTHRCSVCGKEGHNKATCKEVSRNPDKVQERRFATWKKRMKSPKWRGNA